MTDLITKQALKRFFYGLLDKAGIVPSDLEGRATVVISVQVIKDAAKMIEGLPNDELIDISQL